MLGRCSSLCVGFLCTTCAYAPIQEREQSPAPLRFERHEIASSSALGDVSDLQQLDSGRWLVAGTHGALELDESGAAGEETRFAVPELPRLTARIADVDGDGTLEFVRFAQGWVPPTAVLNRDGSVRWSVDLPSRSEQVFDLDHDGRCELLVGPPNSADARLLDHEGRTLWQRPWEDPSANVIALDTDGDGLDEILWTDGEALRVCDRDGEERFRVHPPDDAYVNALELVDPARDARAPFARARVALGFHAQRILEGEQRTLWLAEDARSVLGETTEDERDSVPLGRVDRSSGDFLLLQKVHLREQAWPAGFESSELALFVLDRERRLAADERFAKPGQEVSVAEGVLRIVDEEPLRVWIGFGSTIWELGEVSSSSGSGPR